jgi:hypothetical protein
MNKNVLLSIMLGCYLLPIYYVYYYYDANCSVSNIICTNDRQQPIFWFMIAMGIGTVLYEVERNDNYSLLLISILLIGIYGLIMVNETNTIHYVFASVVFIAILCFMIRQCILTDCDIVLSSSLLLEVVMLVYIITHMSEDIFYGEIIYILNFAFYYIYLHFIQ